MKPHPISIRPHSDQNNALQVTLYWFLLEDTFGFRVLSLHASVGMSVCQSVCPHDNSGPIEARITKFRPKMQNGLLKVLAVLWSDGPWPSKSNERSKSTFTPFWACPHYNSSPIQARVTKFGPEVQNTFIKLKIWSLWIVMSRCVPNKF